MAARESIANQMNNLKAVLDEHDAAIDELTDDSVGHCLHSGVGAIRANISTTDLRWLVPPYVVYLLR